MEITDVNTLFGAYPSRHPDSTPEALVELMNANGITYSLTLSTWGAYHEDSSGNKETIQACTKYHQLVPVATINPSGYWNQPGIIEALASYEMYRFFPHDQGWPYYYAPFLSLLKRISSSGTNKPVMISVRNPGDITQIASTLSSNTMPIIMEGVSITTLTEAMLVMKDMPNLYLETHALKAPGALELIKDVVGINRILFGSDAPGLSLGAALRYIRSSNLSDQDKAMILSGNVEVIWHGGKG